MGARDHTGFVLLWVSPSHAATPWHSACTARTGDYFPALLQQLQNRDTLGCCPVQSTEQYPLCAECNPRLAHIRAHTVPCFACTYPMYETQNICDNCHIRMPTGLWQGARQNPSHRGKVPKPMLRHATKAGARRTRPQRTLGGRTAEPTTNHRAQIPIPPVFRNPMNSGRVT